MDENKEIRPGENMYDQLRQMSLDTMPEQLELSLSSNETIVYGVVLDWNMGVNIVTLTAFQSGDASLYLSSGGGVIGGVKHETVNKAAKKLVGDAQNFLSQTSATKSTSLPKAHEVKFHLLTNQGKFVATESMKNFANDTSPLLDLFISANVLITELREIAEKKDKQK